MFGLGIGRSAYRLLATGLGLVLLLPAHSLGQGVSTARRVSSRIGMAPRARLKQVLRGSTPANLRRQRAREGSYRARLKIRTLEDRSQVPNPPLTGEWSDGRSVMVLRELTGNRLMISRPGSWQPDRVYAIVASESERLVLVGENPVMVAGRFRQLREDGALSLSADANTLIGVMRVFDEYSDGSRTAPGRIQVTPLSWRRRVPLDPATVAAWETAKNSQPLRLMMEKQRKEEEEARRRAEADERRRQEEERRRIEEEEMALEAAFLDEDYDPHSRIPRMPAMPPAPALVVLAAASATEERAAEPAAGKTPRRRVTAGGMGASSVSPEVKAYLTETVPAVRASLKRLETVNKSLNAKMMANPLQAMGIVTTGLMPALADFRKIVTSRKPANRELTKVHTNLTEAVFLQEQLLPAMKGAAMSPGPASISRLKKLGDQVARKIRAFEMGVAVLAGASGRGPRPE